MKLEKRSVLREWVKLSFAVAAMMCCLATQGEKYYWTDNGEGNWGDGTKWHKASYKGTTGTVPGLGDEAWIYNTASGAKINIDGNYSVSVVNFDNISGKGTVTFAGNGRLLVEGLPEGTTTSLTVKKNWELTLDGPEVTCTDTYNRGTVQYCEQGTLIVKSGVFKPTTLYIKAEPGRLVIDGGTVTGNGQINLQNGWDGLTTPVCFVDLKSGLLAAKCVFSVGTFTMTGGTWDRSHTTVFSNSKYYFPALLTNENMKVDIQGGEKIVMHADDTPPDGFFWPVKDLVRTNSSSAATWTPFPSDGTYAFRDIITPNLTFLVTNNVVLSGRNLDVYKLAISKGAHDMEFNVSTVRVHTAGTVNHTTDDTSALPIKINSRNLVRFESDTANSTSRFLPFSNTNVYWRFSKGLEMCTTAADGVSPANYYLRAPIFDKAASVDVSGTGTAELYFSWYISKNPADGMGRMAIDWFSNQLERVSITGGGELKFTGWTWDASAYPLQVEKFVLGPGSRLNTLATGYAHIDANEVELSPSATLWLTTPDKSSDSYFPNAPIMTGPGHLNDFQTPESRPAVALATAGASNLWDFAWINGQPVVWRKDQPQRATCNMTRTKMSKWRGTVDSNWSNSANWLIDDGKEQADNPLEQAMVFDGGYTNTRITVNSTVQAYLVRVYDKTAPVAFVGNGAIEFGCTGITTWGAAASDADVDNAIVCVGKHPLVFDVPVRLSASIDSSRNLSVNYGGSGRAYVAFMKTLDGGDRLTLRGDVRIGGEATAKNICFCEQRNSLPAKRTRLSVIPGGSFTATWQTTVQGTYTENVEIFVYSNATFTVLNPSSDCVWGADVVRRPTWVKKFGKFDCRAPLGGSGKVSFTGKGEVRLADTGSKATADYPVELEDVTFAIDSFTAGHPIVLKGSPTWAAKTDWTYALGAVAVPSGETLTVDTGDLDTGVGHSVAINSALSAEKLVKKGAGTLTLGSSGNSIGEVSVEAGTLAIAASHAFDSLVVASGAELQIAPGVTVALSGSVDLTDVTIAAAAGKNWTTILTVPEGCTITGVQTDDGQPFMMRVVESGTGFALQMRRRPGTIISFR